jgi:hypothetical protein
MTADTQPDTRPDVAPAPGDDRRAGWPVFVLAGLSVAWLAATLWSAHATITGSGGDDLLALNRAALVLPSVITASLVAGVAIGLVAIGLLGRRGRALSHLVRLAVGFGTGVVTGLVIMALILTSYGTGSSLVVLASGVAAASAIGGVVSAIRVDAIVGAAVAGTLAWFLLGLVQGALNDQLLGLFGAGDSAASRVHATSRLLLTVALSGGILAGLVAYRYLRPWADGWRWPAYLAAGAGPGLLLVLANLVTLVGGARLRALAAASSEADGTALHYIGTAGLNTALVVLFIGAITAMIAFGRTLTGPEGQTS